MRPASVAFFGSSLVSAYWNGAATYYRGIIRALYARGHHVTFFEPDAFDRQKHRDIPDPPWAEVVVYQGEEGARRSLDRARDFDLVVKASGVGAYDQLLEEAVADLRGPGQSALFWDVDTPATLARVHDDASDPFRALIPRYDLILTYGGGPPVVAAYEELGARRCVPIYNGVDPSTHHTVHPDPRFVGTLGFLGNRLPDREKRVDQFFFEAARTLPDRRFVLGGSGWDGGGPENVAYVGHVYTRDHNAFNCSLGAVLNINRSSMAEVGYSPATRIFESAGAGACIVSDAWVGLEQFLEPEKEVLIAQDGEEVAEHLRRRTDTERRKIGDAAKARVLSEHTYAHRVSELVRVLST